MKTLYTVTNWPSQRWPNFAQREMICSYSGECWLDPASMNALQRLRDTVGVPLPIPSGYRGATAYEVIAAAKDCGFTGIGVNQSSEGRFIHLDTITELDNFPAERPTIWSY